MKVYSYEQLFLMFAMVLIWSDSVAQTQPNIVFVLTDDQGWGGFDEFYGFLSGHYANYFNTMLDGDMKGKKAMAEEGGVRVPFFIRWPRAIPAGKVIQDNAAYIDLLPTLTELAGISKAGTKPLDGVSLKPVIVGEITLPERLLFTSINKKNGVRKWPYLLSGSDLYDLSKDSTQQANLATTQPVCSKRCRGHWIGSMVC